MGLVWDKVEDRTFESGLDKGVLYLPDGTPVVWNGLTSVIEHFDKQTNSVYFDGMKINDLVVLGDFSATMKAVTYPDEFAELEGLSSDRNGLFFGDQMPKTFALCYRTQVGTPFEPEEGYKIHVLYNVTAIPSDKTFASMSSEPNLVEFEWEITAVPEEIPGQRPTAHIIIDSRMFDPWLLEEIEGILYSGNPDAASLIPMQEFVAYIRDWFRVKITDNGDGTWTAESMRDGFISFLDGLETVFQITQINATYLNDYTYHISDTLDVTEVPQIKIVYNGDGTWTASTDNEGLIEIDSGMFEIKNANAEFLTSDLFRIEDTTAED